jgi:hypothetical protein
MIVVVVGLVGLVLLLAGPVMVAHGLAGRRSVARELAQQRITFPARDALPATLVRHAGLSVHTGTQALAFSELIAVHVAKATKGLTYAEIAEQWQDGGRTDERLAKVRDTAFMGQSLRGALLGAYQAWQVTLLVIGLGGLFTATGMAFVALAAHIT